MDVLKLSFVNGETVDFPFSVDSMLSVETPDGVNGTQRGAWGEIAHVEYVKNAAAEVEFIDRGSPVITSEPQSGVAAVADEPPADPGPAPADAVPAEEPTPDPQHADLSSAGASASDKPAQSEETTASDGSTISADSSDATTDDAQPEK